MKILHIVVAIIVCAFLYLLVFERDRLKGFSGTSDVSENSGQTDQGKNLKTAASTSGGEPQKLVSVIALHSQAKPIQNAVILRGRTQAARQVTVKAETSGTVISTPLRKGAHIKVGQSLCQLDPGTRSASMAQAKAGLAGANSRLPEARARMAAAKAQMAGAKAALSEAEINENAARKLKAGGYASTTRLASATATLQQALSGIQAAKAAAEAAKAAEQSASANIEAAKANIASIEKDIENLSITAPFDGILEQDTAELGSLLQPGSPCATIIQLNPIKLVGFAPETEIDRLNIGALAGARLTTGREISGKISFLSRSSDPVTRTFRVEAEIANPDLSIRDGQSVELLVAASGTNAHLLPQSSLTFNNAGDLGVRIVGKGNIVDFAPVSIAQDSHEGVWVSGLPDQVDVIIIGHEYVIKGVKVSVTYSGDTK